MSESTLMLLERAQAELASIRALLNLPASADVVEAVRRIVEDCSQTVTKVIEVIDKIQPFQHRCIDPENIKICGIGSYVEYLKTAVKKEMEQKK